MQAAKPRSSMLFKIGYLFLAIIFIREIAVHWQLANNGLPDLVECSAALRDAQQQNAILRNKSNSFVAAIEPEAIKPAFHEVVQQRQMPVATEGQQHLSSVDIFRRFVLQPPAPAKVPYNLHNKEATHYSQSEQDKKIDNLLKQREKGFFIEVRQVHCHPPAADAHSKISDLARIIANVHKYLLSAGCFELDSAHAVPSDNIPSYPYRPLRPISGKPRIHERTHTPSLFPPLALSPPPHASYPLSARPSPPPCCSLLIHK